MANKKRYKSTLTRITRLKSLTRQYYEPGNQSRCYKFVWRRYVYPEFGIHYRTYLRLIGAEEEPSEDDRQLTLFGD